VLFLTLFQLVPALFGLHSWYITLPFTSQMFLERYKIIKFHALPTASRAFRILPLLNY
jgi:hypothetical protein